MKKSKSKSKSHSAHKKEKKALESSVIVQIKELIAHFGKVKKSDKAIERFSKKIVKKLKVEPKPEVPTLLIEEPVLPEKALASNAAPTKKQKPVVEQI